MTDCERTSLYFDGELPEADEAVVLAHLAGCATCQGELGDWMGIELALSRRRAGARRRRPTPWLAGAIVIAAAAAVALLWMRVRDPVEQRITLAEIRPIEARFTAKAFDGHRGYRVPRDGAAHELVALSVLTELERRGDRRGLAAAYTLGGDLARARAALDGLVSSPERFSDAAAIALAAGDPVSALVQADSALAGAPQLAPAHWNRALALQALGLPLAAAAELDPVAARHEPGWTEEAAQRAHALRTPLADRTHELAIYRAAAAAMVAGTGPALTAEDARRHPGLAWRDLFDALAVAGSADDARALAPLAAELDRLARSDRATRAVTAVSARDFTVRRRFQARYRALVAGTLDAAALAAMLAELAQAGDGVADILTSATVQAPPTAADQARLARLPDEPWLAIQRARREGQLRSAAGDPFGAERALLGAVPACKEPVWGLVCGMVERDLGALYLRMRRLDEAEVHLRAARAAYAGAGAFAHEDNVLPHHVNLERLRQRDRVASAYLDEIGERTPERCDTTRFVDDGQAVIAFDAGDFARARARLPAPDRCGGLPSAARVMLAVDLARLGDATDRTHAAAQISAATRAAGSPAVAAQIGNGRLRIDADPRAGAQEVRRGLEATASLVAEPGTAGELRALGYATLIGDAGARGDWDAALALFGEELGGAVPAGCVVAASSDNERATAVVRGADGTLRGHHQPARPFASPAAAPVVPDALASSLTGCPTIAVIARPPLHGSDELLPAALPWSFVGRPAHGVPAALPPRRVIVSDARPPAALGLPPLAGVDAPGATQLTGLDATPGRVLAALRDATYLELHAHGIVDSSEAAFVALSPDPAGEFALTVAQVRAAHLDGAPVVVLAACHGARTAARYLATRWSLPDAFLAAGARAVIAASTAIPDDQGAALFGELRSRLDRGELPAHAVAALRAARIASGQAWARGLMVFE